MSGVGGPGRAGGERWRSQGEARVSHGGLREVAESGRGPREELGE